MHPSCVQVAVSTETVPVPVRVTRKLPIDVWAIAMPPVVASGEPDPMGNVTCRPATVADT